MAESTVTITPEQWAVLNDAAGIIQTAAWGGAILAGLFAVTLGAIFTRAVWVR